MTAKEYLRQYENLARRIRNINQQLEYAEAEADTIRSTSDNDGMPHGSNIGHPTEEKAIRIADLKRTLLDIRDDANVTRLEILATIMQVDGVEQDVLVCRYVKLMSWETIAVEIGYSWTQTHEYHKSALKAIQTILDNNKSPN